MAKHGGGYVILDLRDAELDNGETESTGFVNLTDQQINAIKTAADEKLPVMYIGRGATSDYILSSVECAAFTYAINKDGNYSIAVPNASMYEVGYFSVAQLQGTSLTIYMPA